MKSDHGKDQGTTHACSQAHLHTTFRLWEVIRLLRSPAREWPGRIPRQIQNPRGSRAQSPQPRGEASSESNSQHPRATPTHYPTAEQSCAAHNPRLRPQLAPLRREGSFSGTQLTGQDALSWVGQRSPKACPPGASGCDPGNRVSADVITAHRVAVRSRQTRVGPASEDKVLVREGRTQRHRKKPSEHGEQTGGCGHKTTTSGALGRWKHQGGPSPQPPERAGPSETGFGH